MKVINDNSCSWINDLIPRYDIKSLENNANAIRMRDIVDNIILAHSGMQQQPYGVGIGAWGHSGGDFIFISKE